MNVVIRGNVAEFSTTFFDAFGNPTNPASVVLQLYFPTATGYTTVPVAMSVSGNNWTYAWDTASAGACSGTVWWSVRATNPHAADDGYFTLSANPANPSA